jgi:hypothetical protein
MHVLGATLTLWSQLCALIYHAYMRWPCRLVRADRDSVCCVCHFAETTMA